MKGAYFTHPFLFKKLQKNIDKLQNLDIINFYIKTNKTKKQTFPK